MPQLRKDPIIGRWVIIATERAMRPDQFQHEPVVVTRPAGCPFCTGNEGSTPPEILALRDSSPPNGPGWRVRVVPNKFPALRVEGNLDKSGEGIYDMMNGVGAHEVIVEDPAHVMSATDIDPVRLSEVLWIYKARLLDLKRDPRLVYGLVFKNVGVRAGASLEHTHSQLIVTPIVPLRVQGEIDRCKEFYDFRGRCLICDMIQQERQTKVRIVLESPNFISLCPFAARFPFETWILPRRHLSHYESTPDAHMGELAQVLSGTIERLEKVAARPPYNYLIHTGPMNAAGMDHYHWHFELIPRITRVAGFEWGTGFYINPLPPEDAARYLREAQV